jgi:hypothetical protein
LSLSRRRMPGGFSLEVRGDLAQGADDDDYQACDGYPEGDDRHGPPNWHQ